MLERFLKIEKYLVLVLSLVVPLISISPNIFAYFNTPEGKVFSGTTTIFSQTDVFTYFANMRQGYEGNWLWQNRYNLLSDDTGKSPIYLPYIFLGHLAKIFNLSIPLTYHLSAYLFGVLLFLFSYKLISLFIKDVRWRIFCFLMLCFSFVPLSPFEGLSFLLTVEKPHFTLSVLFFLLAIFRGFLLLQKGKSLLDPILFLVSFMLCLVHPYMLVLVAGILAFFALCSSKSLVFLVRKFTLFLFYCFTLAVIYTYLLNRSVATRVFLYQTGIIKPSIYYYGLLVIVIFAFSFIIFRLLKSKGPEILFLSIWFYCQSFAMLLPIGGNVLIHKGYPLVIFLLLVLFFVRLKINFSAGFIWILLISSSCLALSAIYYESLGLVPLSYLERGDVSAFEWIQKENTAQKRALSSFLTGNILPAYSDSFVFCGHWNQTVNVEDKINLTNAFFLDQMSDSEAFAFLSENEVNYVYFGTYENIINKSGKLDYSSLEEVYSNKGVKIYGLRKR